MDSPTPTRFPKQVATGTGIAPYRTFVRRLFVEKTPAGKAFKVRHTRALGRLTDTTRTLARSLHTIDPHAAP